MAEILSFEKRLRDGRVVAINSWGTGWQRLVFRNQESFDKTKELIEQGKMLPAPEGYAEVPFGYKGV
jgi:hypothetical protein